ncbi:hypothetical protein BDY17DRAFT_322574 [Neohortaea acidophila]|uniref:Zinc finger PHD-type domain-containing protein n=1 Tax=Neohortaea acidophila TaxID=245834 RepID=A0A6A6Q196_9PEZI|nr:uncharacterized protein BDY17DRAFT_322574 [Neohortaea acidophila]KAF2485759.1 hypothetical protein BDY17DRAFT_322574 [Neohortaea acidophila]
MDFDPSYNEGPVDWNFPSPNATPTHQSFGSNAMQTPKTSTFPSHFQDAFSTPQFPSYATPQPTQNPSMTPIQRPHTSSDTLRSNYYAQITGGGGQHYAQAVHPSSQSDGGMAAISPAYAGVYPAAMPQHMSQGFDPTQMQTPPPTRGTSAKRLQQAQQIAFGTPSTIASRRFLTPQVPTVPSSQEMHGHQTPVQFPQLQFSPDVYQFAHFGPASAPVLPHSRILWDPMTSPVHPMPPPPLDDPFAPVPSTGMTWGSPALPQGTSPSAIFDTPAMNGFAVQGIPQRRAAARPVSASFHTSHQSPPAAGVNPSLVYSSPIPPVVRSNAKPNKARVSSAPQKKSGPLDAQNRLEAADAPPNRSTAPLQRSNTTGMSRAKSALLSMSDARSSAGSAINRTASPAKRLGRPSLGSIAEARPRQRTSVVLTVDENGTARTETKRIDSSPARSIRERYPALFDSDSSDAETDTSERLPSRPSSFIFDKRDERRSKAAKLDPPVENLEGLSLPRSNSSASLKKGIPLPRAVIAATAQLRRHGSMKRATHGRSMRRNPAASSASSLIETTSQAEATTSLPVQDHSPQASHDGTAFGGPPPSSAESTLNMYNRRWSVMSFEQHPQAQPQALPALSPQQPQYQHHQQHPPQHQQQYYPPPFTGESGIYPHHQQPALQIRCVCGLGDTGFRLIQCTSCTQWLHEPCVGIGPQDAPPPHFTCFLCTKPPPRHHPRSANNASVR